MFPEEGKMSHASRSRGGQPPDLPDDSAALPADPVPDVPEAPPAPSPRRPSRPGRRLVPADQQRRAEFTPQQRLLILDAWQRSGLPARDFAPLARRFERARPNQLWQTDLFTFILKRQNRRVYLVGFLDDHSRFITGYGLHASASSALVLEVFRAAVDSFGAPEEVLTDNGSQ